MQLKEGALLERGKYRIIDTLGRGGFGVTYLAEQVMAKRKVCIKEFFPKDYYTREGDTSQLTLASAGFAEMMNKYKAKFIKEAQTIAALEHHNIIHIFDVFEENGTAYYVMEYIEGESLSSLVKREGALSEAVAVGYIRQAADALGYIHDKKIMHLDVKPGNIMVRKDDDRAILIDFGLSKHYDQTSGEATSTTPVGVSHGYAPMEQYKQGGVKEFSPETDIYSLGATLYYLVTGTVPPDAADVADDGLPALPAHLSESTRSAIEHAMADKRKERPHSIKEFLTLLGEDEKVVAPIPEPEPEPVFEETMISVDADVAETEKNTSLDILEPEPEQPIPASQLVQSKKEWTPKYALNKKKSKWWLWLLLLLIVAVGGIVVLSGESEETTGPYKVGDYYNENGKEGVVFEVWADGDHGMIVSLDEAWLQWCTDSQYDKQIVVGASSVGSSKANTDKVMRRSDKNQYPAFTWCRAKGTDWYLPSNEELKTIYYNRSAINSTLELYGDALTAGLHWSSTEYDEFCAWTVYVYTQETDYYGKNDYNCVRAVSAF